MQHGERFNTLSHLFATLLASLGAGILLFLAFSKNDSLRIVSFSIYAMSTIGLYIASTLYHGSQGSLKAMFRRLDYIGIYLKIAGNTTPFMLLILRGEMGYLVLATIWTLAAIGILHEFTLGKKTRRISFLIYFLMCLVVLPAIKPLIEALPAQGSALIFAGYVSYAIGFYFFINDRRHKHGHQVWHVCVIGGTLFQYLCLLIYAT